MNFAQFLHGRAGVLLPLPTMCPAPVPELVEIPEPLVIPRPEDKSVVKAVKRLAQTYPVFDTSKMLNDISTLVMQHVIQGRDAMEVIDELEIVFQRHCARLGKTNCARAGR